MRWIIATLSARFMNSPEGVDDDDCPGSLRPVEAAAGRQCPMISLCSGSASWFSHNALRDLARLRS